MSHCPGSSLEEILACTLSASLSGLLSTLEAGEHSGGTRCTSLAVWAMSEALASKHVWTDQDARMLRAVQQGAHWINEQARFDAEGLNWDEEAWDTSLALIALTSAGVHQDRASQAASWLTNICCPYSKVWYHEIWETTLCCVALIRAEGGRRQAARRLAPRLREVFAWLTEIPLKETGEFINPHYSGFLVWLQAEVLAAGLHEYLSPTEEYKRLTAHTDRVIEWLLGRGLAGEAGLWTHYTFANGYIAYALGRLPRDFHLSSDHDDLAVQWFAQHSEHFEDVEDTALATLAILAIAARRNVYVRLQIPASRTTGAALRCFVAYASSSQALFRELDYFVRQHVEGVELVDWDKFQPGALLREELDRVCTDCAAAIVLVTKDDIKPQAAGELSLVPRDNVIFEAGLFAGRLRWDRTILIVEKGTTQPSDWDGTLCIELPDRNRFSEIHTRVHDSLMRIVRDRHGPR